MGWNHFLWRSKPTGEENTWVWDSEILTSVQIEGAFEKRAFHYSKACIQTANQKEKTDLPLTPNLSAPYHYRHGLSENIYLWCCRKSLNYPELHFNHLQNEDSNHTEVPRDLNFIIWVCTIMRLHRKAKAIIIWKSSLWGSNELIIYKISRLSTSFLS